MHEEQSNHPSSIQNPEPESVNGNMFTIGNALAPRAPEHLEDTGIDPDLLANLALRFAHTVPTFTTERAALHLCLPQTLVGELLTNLRKDKLIENLGAAGPLDYRFTVTDAGRERAKRLMEVSGYAGAAPVSLEYYTSFLEDQLSRFPRVTPKDVTDAISDLVLTEDAVQVASFAGSSNRSLFIYGPPGNGKTTLAHLLHDATKGDLWIPYCIGVDSSIIRVFDPQFHDVVDIDVPAEQAHEVDRRWVRIRRPFMVAGG